MSESVDPLFISHQLTGVMDGSVHCLRCGWSGWPDEVPPTCPPGAAFEPLSISDVLREHRERLGLTKTEAALRARVARKTWHEIEAGTRNMPHQQTLTRIEQALDMEPGSLRSDDRDNPLPVSKRIQLLEETLGAALLAIKSLENRLLAAERATPWKAPPKPRPPKLPPRR